MYTHPDQTALKHEANFQDGYSFQSLYPGHLYNMYQQFPMHQVPMPQTMNMLPANYFNPAANNGLTFGENYAESPRVIVADNGNDYAPMIPEKERRAEKCDEVSGRLCLLSATKKYKVTIGEICRRINQPEGLHTSLINGILRNAKAKDNGAKLRSKLQNYDITLPQGRRKTSKTTSFTAFTEEEAQQLAKDFSMLCKEKGGANQLGLAYVEEQIAKDVPLEEIAKEIDVIRKFQEFLLRYHQADVLPDDMDYTNEAEKSVMTLSLLTHGFSHVAINGTANYFLGMTDVMKTEVSRRGGQQQICEDVMGQMARLTQHQPSIPPGYFPPVNQ